MNIRTSSIVFALSCVTLGGVVYSQSASLSAANVGAHPFSTISASYEKLASAEIQGMDRKVTKKFEGSTLEEILSWLSNEKLNFVADLSAYKNARISLSFDDVKLGDALDSIATLFDAHWERKGGVFLLKPTGKLAAAKATDVVTRAPLAMPSEVRSAPKINVRGLPVPDEEDFEWVIPQMGIEDKGDILDRIEIQSKDGKTKAFRYDSKAKKMVPIEMKDLSKLAPKFRMNEFKAPNFQGFGDAPMVWGSEGQAFKIDPKTGKQVPLSKEEKAKLEKEWEAWGEKFGKQWEKWGEEYGKQWENWAKEFESSQKDSKGRVFVMPKMPNGAMPKFDGSKMPQQFFYKFDGNAHEMTPQQKKAFEESMRNMEKSLKDMKLNEKLFDEKAMKQLHDHLLKSKVMDEKAMKELEKQIKGFKFEGGSVKMLDPKAFKELEGLKELRLAPHGEMKAPLMPKTPMVLTSERIGKLLDSLTDKQKATHKDRGYLKWSELTPAQHEMLGVKADGSFSVSFTIGDRSITIKND